MSHIPRALWRAFLGASENSIIRPCRYRAVRGPIQMHWRLTVCVWSAVLAAFSGVCSQALAGELYGIALKDEILVDPAVKRELLLTPEQLVFLDGFVDKARSAIREANSEAPWPGAEANEEEMGKWLDATFAAALPVIDALGEELKAELNPTQSQRLAELSVQYRCDMNLCGFLVTNAQIRKALEISDDQLAQLRTQWVEQVRQKAATSMRTWKHPALDILTARQQETLGQLAGDPFLPRQYMADQGKDLAVMKLSVRVHLLTSHSTEELQCTFSDSEIREHFAGVNAIWAQARIVWEIESIIREPVATSDGYRELLAAAANRDVTKRSPRDRGRVLLAMIPEKERLDPGFNVYVVEDLGSLMGGVFMPLDQIVLYGRFGPKGEQRPTVLAHELGHSLSLPHVDGNAPENLMATGGRKRVQMLSTYLNADQVEAARRQARTGRPFSTSAQLARRIDQLFKSNDADGDGHISREEARPIVKSNFPTFDADGDGVVDRLEFDQNAPKFLGGTPPSVGGQGGTPKGPPPAMIEQLFKKNDSNGDGHISLDEAQPGVKSNFPKFDRDKDGKIDWNEFQGFFSKLRRPD